jgi:hypothetical protein
MAAECDFCGGSRFPYLTKKPSRRVPRKLELVIHPLLPWKATGINVHWEQTSWEGIAPSRMDRIVVRLQWVVCRASMHSSLNMLVERCSWVLQSFWRLQARGRAKKRFSMQKSSSLLTSAWWPQGAQPYDKQSDPTHAGSLQAQGTPSGPFPFVWSSLVQRFCAYTNVHVAVQVHVYYLHDRLQMLGTNHCI